MRKMRMLVMALFLMVSLVLLPSIGMADTNTLRIVMLKVKGDAFVVYLPNDKIMLIDGGTGTDPTTGKPTCDEICPDDLVPLVKQLDGLGITHIDYLVGTHEHGDHIGAWDELINSSITITKIYFPDYPAPSGNPFYTAMVSAANSKGIPIQKLSAGDILIPDTHIGSKKLSAKVLFPDPAANNFVKGTIANRYSLIFDLKYGNRGILFMGDTGEEAEEWILSHNTLHNIQVVKAPHHGILGSNPEFFIQALATQGGIHQLNKVLISQTRPDNKIDRTKDRYDTYHVDIWSTQIKGQVEIVTDGTKDWAANKTKEVKTNGSWPDAS